MTRSPLIVAALGTLAIGASADIIEFTFTGQIDSLGGSLPAPIEVGDAFTFQYRFNSDATDADPAPNVGLYSGAVHLPTLDIGAWSASGLSSGDIGVLNDGFAGDSYSATVQHPLIGAWVSMTNLGGDAFGSDALPLDLDLTDWDLPNFSVEVLVGPAYWNAAGTVTGFSSRVVPTPGAAGFGVLELASMTRRRRTR